jgi:hypothetical protein
MRELRDWQSAGVITFRIGDLGFRIENTKTKFENYLRIPQSAFPNPQSRYSSTPIKLAIFTGKAIELQPDPKDQVLRGE